jgi:DNA-binding XRE family transcriptional regulator
VGEHSVHVRCLIGVRHHSMEHKHKTYVRTHRRRWGLTQDELAFLIGVNSRSMVSRVEGLKRRPHLATAFAFWVVFGVPPFELFPELLTEVEEGVLQRSRELYDTLQGNPSKATRTKLDLLEAVFARQEQRDSTVDV